YVASPEDDQYTTLRKKTVSMFVEGSVFQIGEVPMLGKLHDLKPLAMNGHPVWRDGRGIFLNSKSL
ncbi:MAG: type III-A CRISPR-associated RAMP protein Csm4, partial [Lewinellaceae bacterium]|nr:type III-A CRISPR-associated RAMP protein Csm4 [Lewinellaceae bacterium]